MRTVFGIIAAFLAGLAAARVDPGLSEAQVRLTDFAAIWAGLVIIYSLLSWAISYIRAELKRVQ